MSLDSDVIVDRRRMRRKLTFWRVAAVLLTMAAVVTVGILTTSSGTSTVQHRSTGPDPAPRNSTEGSRRARTPATC